METRAGGRRTSPGDARAWSGVGHFRPWQRNDRWDTPCRAAESGYGVAVRDETAGRPGVGRLRSRWSSGRRNMRDMGRTDGDNKMGRC